MSSIPPKGSDFSGSSLQTETACPRFPLGALGKVTDASTGRGIRDVVVQVTETGQSVTTKGSGKYTLSDVPAGDRTVTALRTGFLVLPGVSVTVETGETSVVDFTLVPLTDTGAKD